jgi:hypothetical protein
VLLGDLAGAALRGGHRLLRLGEAGLLIEQHLFELVRRRDRVGQLADAGFRLRERLFELRRARLLGGDGRLQLLPRRGLLLELPGAGLGLGLDGLELGDASLLLCDRRFQVLPGGLELLVGGLELRHALQLPFVRCGTRGALDDGRFQAAVLGDVAERTERRWQAVDWRRMRDCMDLHVVVRSAQARQVRFDRASFTGGDAREEFPDGRLCVVSDQIQERRSQYLVQPLGAQHGKSRVVHREKGTVGRDARQADGLRFDDETEVSIRGWLGGYGRLLGDSHVEADDDRADPIGISATLRTRISSC